MAVDLLGLCCGGQKQKRTNVLERGESSRYRCRLLRTKIFLPLACARMAFRRPSLEGDGSWSAGIAHPLSPLESAGSTVI